MSSHACQLLEEDMGTAARKCKRRRRQWLRPAHSIGLAGDSVWLSTHLLVVIALEPVSLGQFLKTICCFVSDLGGFIYNYFMNGTLKQIPRESVAHLKP